MKKITILLLFIVVGVTNIFSQTTSTKKSSTKKSTVKSNTANKSNTTKVAGTNTVKQTVVVNANTPQPKPQNKESLNFDSILKTMKSEISADLIHGVWKYQSTMEFRGEKVDEYTRSYYDFSTGGQQQLIDLNDPNKKQDLTDPNYMKMMEEAKAHSMGREKTSQQDLVMVFDPNVEYFFWNQGNGKQLFVIRHKSGNDISYLNNMNTHYSTNFDSKSGKYFLNLDCVEISGLNKKFQILSLTKDQMVIADIDHREIHFFQKSS